MILADKLNKLRTSSGLSQEQLAEKMHVSRQSISKWESGSSIPTMDKIVELSNIYGISTDYLLKDEMESLPDEIVAEFDQEASVREISIEDANDFLYRVNKVSRKIAFGVLLCILSPVCLMTFLGLSEMPNGIIGENAATGIGICVMMILIASAVFIFVLSSIDTKKYEFLEKETIRLSYGVEGILQKDEEEFLPSFYKSLALGIALCIIATVPLIGLSLAEDDFEVEYLSLFGVAILLLLVSVGVYLIVKASIVKGSYDKLLQKGDYTKSKKKAGKKLETFTGVYWSSMTAAYLLISFLTRRWDISWIIWPVGAILFAAVYSILEMTISRKQTDNCMR